MSSPHWSYLINILSKHKHNYQILSPYILLVALLFCFINNYSRINMFFLRCTCIYTPLDNYFALYSGWTILQRIYTAKTENAILTIFPLDYIHSEGYGKGSAYEEIDCALAPNHSIWQQNGWWWCTVHQQGLVSVHIPEFSPSSDYCFLVFFPSYTLNNCW